MGQEGYTALLSDADIHYLKAPLAPLAAKAAKFTADAVIQVKRFEGRGKRTVLRSDEKRSAEGAEQGWG